jgi:hypothetical protein
MKLREMMLAAARLVMDTCDGTTTATGTSTTLKDSALLHQNDYFKNGTLWITSGTYSGLVALVTFQDGEGNITFTPAAGGVIASGVTYSIAPATFNRSALKIAGNMAMISEEYMLKDDTLTTVATQEEFTLPTGVKNIRRVQIATATAAPYKWETNFGWEELNGTLIFDTWAAPGASGFKIRIWYVGVPTEIAEATEINTGIDLDHMMWKTVEKLWRDVLEMKNRDVPVAPDLFNEAKANIEMAKTRAGAMTTIARDPKLNGDW